MDNQSAVAIFSTGAGKSLCYQLPAMFLPHMTLVVSPLLALMKDQIDFLLELGIPAARLDSTLNKDEYKQILEKARNGNLKVLLIAVEHMIDFFESNSCISKKLAQYFEEDIKKDRCEHCSFCNTGPAVIEHTIQLPPLETYNYNNLTDKFIKAAGIYSTVLNITKFLCGVSFPVLVKLKAKQLYHFGVLEEYPFLTVKKWVDEFSNG